MTKNILTITLNPTVDKSTTVNAVKPEKKLRCESPKYEPGGGGINVSRGLHRLGISSTAFFTSGGRTGKLLEDLLEKENIKTLVFSVSAQTRENFIVVDTSSNEQYRFGMPGDEISEDESQGLAKSILEFAPDIAVISGSLPPGMSGRYLRDLIRELKTIKTKIILDTSGEALTEALKEGVYLIKPNLGELSRLSGKEQLDNDTADEAAKELIKAGYAEIVAVSMGPHGAYLVTADETLQIPAPSVKKRSTVGAGDSMVAGMVSVMAKGGSLLEMACMGVACGSAATMSTGTGLFIKEDTDRLYSWLIKRCG